MPLDERWDRLRPSDWASFARAWVEELRKAPESPDSDAGDSVERPECDVGDSVVWMNFTARPEHQWLFIREAVSQAESDEELDHIAAGPMEHLLGWHGADYIEAVEAQAASDLKFGRMLGGVWKYMMNEDVWERVQALKARYASSSGPTSDA